LRLLIAGRLARAGRAAPGWVEVAAGRSARDADLVLLGSDGAVQRVMRRGRWVA
jgi:hypothetical protein